MIFGFPSNSIQPYRLRRCRRPLSAFSWKWFVLHLRRHVVWCLEALVPVVWPPYNVHHLHQVHYHNRILVDFARPIRWAHQNFRATPCAALKSECKETKAISKQINVNVMNVGGKWHWLWFIFRRINIHVNAGPNAIMMLLRTFFLVGGCLVFHCYFNNWNKKVLSRSSTLKNENKTYRMCTPFWDTCANRGGMDCQMLLYRPISYSVFVHGIIASQSLLQTIPNKLFVCRKWKKENGRKETVSKN